MWTKNSQPYWKNVRKPRGGDFLVTLYSCCNCHHMTKCYLYVLYWQADESDSIVHTADVTASPKRHPDTVTGPTITEPVVDYVNTFPVHVNIERAFHLPMVLENRYCDTAFLFTDGVFRIVIFIFTKKHVNND